MDYEDKLGYFDATEYTYYKEFINSNSTVPITYNIIKSIVTLIWRAIHETSIAAPIRITFSASGTYWLLGPIMVSKLEYIC